jgi:hypothetical protein
LYGRLVRSPDDLGDTSPAHAAWRRTESTIKDTLCRSRARSTHRGRAAVRLGRSRAFAVASALFFDHLHDLLIGRVRLHGPVWSISSGVSSSRLGAQFAFTHSPHSFNELNSDLIRRGVLWAPLPLRPFYLVEGPLLVFRISPVRPACYPRLGQAKRWWPVRRIRGQWVCARLHHTESKCIQSATRGSEASTTSLLRSRGRCRCRSACLLPRAVAADPHAPHLRLRAPAGLLTGSTTPRDSSPSGYESATDKSGFPTGKPVRNGLRWFEGSSTG